MISIRVDSHVLGDLADSTGGSVTSITLTPEIGPPVKALQLIAVLEGGNSILFYAIINKPLVKVLTPPPSIDSLSPFKTGSAIG